MNFHPGDRGIDRRGLDIIKAHRRRSDQHQLARDHAGRDILIKHIGRRNIDRGIVMREMDPELAVAIGRKLQTADGDALDAGFVGLDQDRARGGHHSQDFKAQGRQRKALGLHQHRHPSDDSVTLALDREQPAPGSRLFEKRHVAQQPGKLDHETLRLLAKRGYAGHRERFVELGEDL